MQKEFKVTVISKLRCLVTVKAKNEQEAREKALDLVSNAPGDYFEPDYPDYDTEKIIEDVSKRISLTEFADEFNKANEEGRKIYGVVVFSQSNWKEEYSLESRSYATYSDQWGWDYTKMGRCRIGYALDGSDDCRMDYYNWEVDYCYFITKEEFEEVLKKYN